MIVPFTPSGVDHFVLWIRGLEDARAWYKTVLGCQDGYDYPDIAMAHLWYGPVLIGLWDADDPKSFYATPPENAGKNLHHIALAWTGGSEDSVRAHLEASAVTIVKELRQTGSRGFGLSLYFNDPWGNLIELKGPATID